jgi:hypothetical protein
MTSGQTVNGTIITSGGTLANSRAPFMCLQAGDKGVRTIDSIVFEGTGDIGLISLVLVKMIARHSIRSIDAPTEVDYFKDVSQIPQILDDAYLNLICCPFGTVANAPIYGYISTAFI